MGIITEWETVITTQGLVKRFFSLHHALALQSGDVHLVNGLMKLFHNYTSIFIRWILSPTFYVMNISRVMKQLCFVKSSSFGKEH